MTNIRYSHSSLSMFRECEQKFKYAYIDNIESNTDKWASNRDFGSSVHEGIAELLRRLYEYPHISLEEQVAIVSNMAIVHAEQYIYREPEWANEPHTEEYYAQMVYARDIIPELCRTFVPMLELGTRYTVAGAYEFGLTTDTTIPLVEYKFETYDVSKTGEQRLISGIIDAVLIDNQTDTYFLYDWKVRNRLLPLQQVVMDMQLPLYATVLNGFAHDKHTGVSVDVVRMCQILSSPPKPAKLTKKDMPSIQACASYWEYWWETIPYSIRKRLDADEWYDTMVNGGKLRDKSDWVAYEDIPVTNAVSQEVSRMVENTLDRIETAQMMDYFLPVWGSYNCAMCQYSKLCLARRDGDDVNEVIREHYHTKS